jgi:hypothetical protein
MKLLQNLFLAIFLCLSAQSMAQIPGYMGKRLIYDVELQFMPILLTPLPIPMLDTKAFIFVTVWESVMCFHVLIC